MLHRSTSLSLLATTLSLALVAACSAGSGKGASDDADSANGGNGNGDGDDGLDLGNGNGEIRNPDLDLPAPENCGDGILDDDEVCDDGGRDNDDGCYGNCLGIDLGYICPNPGSLCNQFAVCGDGVTAFPEQCDDGGVADGDGCDAGCKLELGFKCPTDDAGLATCSRTTCGDGVVEGTEKCEGSVSEGCTKDCQFAPQCDANGVCSSDCGDGLLLGESCDDGNLLSGDGCSDVCEIEQGYTCEGEVTSGECELSADTGECILRVPAVFRDFSYTHSDFNGTNSPCTAQGRPDPTLGLVEDRLTGGKPVRKTVDAGICNTNFADWYVDKPGTNVTHAAEIVLYDDGEGNYVNRWGSAGERWFTNQGWVGSQNCSTEPCGPYDGNPFFYPVDGIAGALDDGGETGAVSTDAAYGMDGRLWTEQILTGSSPTHNFGFTSEVTYLFTYVEGMDATLKFTGDDDLYVFIGGRLALDLGGLHATFAGQVRIADGRIKGVDMKMQPPQQPPAIAQLVEGPNVTVDMSAADFGLEDSGVYDIKIFHAERQANGSTFKLTLSGFETRRSKCSSHCGDGILALGEQCDDGVNDGGQNECGPGCKLGSYCGDGHVDEGEDCDDKDTSPTAKANCNGCRVVVVR